MELGTLLSPYKLITRFYPVSPKYFSIFRSTTMGQVDGDLHYNAMTKDVPMFEDIQLYKETSSESPVVYYAL
jgi:hypothetical protein